LISFTDIILNSLGSFLEKLNSEYNSTEWEIPKGGKKQNETHIQCGIRELKEETSLDESKYKIIKCIDPIHDVFIGTNNIEYRHIFYTALYNNNGLCDIEHSNNEIDSVKWCCLSEINNIISISEDATVFFEKIYKDIRAKWRDTEKFINFTQIPEQKRVYVNGYLILCTIDKKYRIYSFVKPGSILTNWKDFKRLHE
jgi:8-oxo-dGTP pyrophosphatase MutT (NUDIX family)